MLSPSSISNPETVAERYDEVLYICDDPLRGKAAPVAELIGCKLGDVHTVEIDLTDRTVGHHTVRHCILPLCGSYVPPVFFIHYDCIILDAILSRKTGFCAPPLSPHRAGQTADRAVEDDGADGVVAGVEAVDALGS